MDDVKIELGKVNEVVLYSYIHGAVLAGDEEREVRGGGIKAMTIVTSVLYIIALFREEKC